MRPSGWIRATAMRFKTALLPGRPWETRRVRRPISQKPSEGGLTHQPAFQLGSRTANADVKGSKQRIYGADLVEAHLVDELLEHQRIVREQVHSPLPVVEADGA